MKKGQKMLIEGRKKLSQSCKGRISPRKGVHLSENVKNKLRLYKGKTYEEIYGDRANIEREKRSKSKLGDKNPMKRPEVVQKVRDKLLGRKLPEKTRHKMSQSRLGGKNPNWQGGKSFEPYTIDWTETLKRAIRERDNYICQLCSQYGNIVHHIDYDKKNCNSSNLVTLCIRCSSKVNFNRYCWIKYFTAYE